MPVPRLPLVNAECVRKILVEGLGFDAVVIRNGHDIIRCERADLDFSVPFFANEIFTPTMTEELCEVLEISVQEFQELREKLCDPDPTFDYMN